MKSNADLRTELNNASSEIPNSLFNIAVSNSFCCLNNAISVSDELLIACVIPVISPLDATAVLPFMEPTNSAPCSPAQNSEPVVG